MRIYYPSARVNLAFVPTDTSNSALADDILRLTAIKPSRVEVVHNNAHEADTFTLEMPVAHFSVDPRLIRTLSAEIFIGDTGAVRAQLDTTSNRHVSLLGTMDDLEKTYQSNSTSKVKIQGRDYAAFLLDPKWNGFVDLEGPVSEVVRRVLDAFDAVKRMRVRVIGDEPAFPTGRSKMQRRFSAKSGATVWEGIRDIAGRVGLIPEIFGDEVVLRPPRNTLPSDALPVMVAGRNLKSLTVKKQYGAEYAPNVRITAQDPDTWDIVEGRWPETPEEIKRVFAKQGKVPEETSSIEFKSFSVQHPDPTPAKLKRIARQTHERFLQQQIKVSFETQELRTWSLPADSVGKRTLDESDATFDLTRLRNGSAIRIVIDAASRDILERAISQDQKRRQLQREGFDRQVAAVLAERWRAINAPFFIDRCTHTVDSGTYTLSADAQNKIKVNV
ncbi:MAG: hypothetical protein U5L04_01675 [Trueperaceae bacterium]|nr:hypothetical protein [Trueperaceae bacterium]